MIMTSYGISHMLCADTVPHTQPLSHHPFSKMHISSKQKNHTTAPASSKMESIMAFIPS